MVVALPAVVVNVGRDKMAGERFDRLTQIAHQVCMPVVETDTDIQPIEILLDQIQRGRIALDSGFGMTSIATRTLTLPPA